MFDSGVRGASDVFKALALGAKFVFVGRLWVWGLSIMGETGVRHVMKSLLADFDILLNVAGYRSVEEVDRNALGEHHVTTWFLKHQKIDIWQIPDQRTTHFHRKFHTCKKSLIWLYI
jgi:hypothetical protein